MSHFRDMRKVDTCGGHTVVRMAGAGKGEDSVTRRLPCPPPGYFPFKLEISIEIPDNLDIDTVEAVSQREEVQAMLVNLAVRKH
jgi:hypothetical protein